MPMKIAQSMAGIEGLLSASARAQPGTDASKVSFAESLGESLTASITPNPDKQATKPEVLLPKFGSTDKKADGLAAKAPANSKPLQVVLKAIEGAVSPGGAATAAEASDGSAAGTNTAQMPVAHDGGVNESSAAKDKILKIRQQTADSDGANQVPTGKASEVPTPTGRAELDLRSSREGDTPKETNDVAKISSTDSAKGRQIKASARHKEKCASDAPGNKASQQSQQIGIPVAVQPSATADVPVTNIGLSQMVSGETPESSPLHVEEAGRSGSKPVQGLRQRQGNEAVTKSSPGPKDTMSTTSERVEVTAHEGKAASDEPTKLDRVEHRPSSQDKEHLATQTAVQPGTSATVVPIQTHATATLAVERIASATPAHPLHSSQIEAPASHTTYAPGDHGTITTTPTALEVGVPGGNHGWLKVRAELGGDGSVHASMSSNSATGTEALRRELPQLTSYLHQEQVRVSSVVVHAPQTPMEFSNQASGDSRGQSMNGGSPEGHRGDAGSGGSGSNPSQVGVTGTTSASEGDGDLLLPGGFGSAGGWLSVRA